MNGYLGVVLSMLAVADAAQVPLVSELSAYDYHNKVGTALAAQIRAHEEKYLANRITGGSPAQPEQIPYQVKLISPIALPADRDLSKDFAGEYVVASGYGYTSDSEYWPSGVLSQVKMKVMENSACFEIFGSYIQDKILCTSTVGGHSTCRGDSGGPLTLEISGEINLVGVVSFGANLGCQRGFPAGFSRVTEYVRWIRQLL